MTDKDHHTTSYDVLHRDTAGSSTRGHDFIGEEPLLIRIDEKPYSVVMRTPGEEIAHAAGFCLGEGIVDSTDDFMTIGYCQDLDPNVIDIRLKPQRREKIRDLLDRRGFVSQTSCGICGKELIKDIYQIVTRIEDAHQMPMEDILEGLNQLSTNQKYYQRTRGSHAAVIFDDHQKTISFCEDVGRHNALDKAIGTVLMQGKLSDARWVALTSRISYELVQKSARARLPMMVSMSRPTALAVEMGRNLNITIAFVDKESGLNIVSGENRIMD